MKRAETIFGYVELPPVEAVRLPSPIAGVDASAWTRFVGAVASAPLISVSESNALGMFEMPPRRLADLGVISKLSRTRSPAGRTIWTGVFVPPLTCERFLRSPDMQYRVFCKSMRDYAARIESGEIAKDPQMSMSGALAILHRAGPNGLQTWSEGKQFPATQEIYERAAGIF
jgi:hypothetical protein